MSTGPARIQCHRLLQRCKRFPVLTQCEICLTQLKVDVCGTRINFQCITVLDLGILEFAGGHILLPALEILGLCLLRISRTASHQYSGNEPKGRCDSQMFSVHKLLHFNFSFNWARSRAFWVQFVGQTRSIACGLPLRRHWRKQ